MSITRAVTHVTARRLVEQINAYGVDTPTEVAVEVAALDRLEQMRPPTHERSDLTAAYLERDPEKVDLIARQIAEQDARSAAWTEARIRQGGAIISALAANGDDLTRALAKAAAPLIETINAAAKVETHDLATLMRQGRADEARAVAEADVTAADLAALYQLRNQITRGAEYGVGYVTAGVWKHPEKFEASKRGNIAAEGVTATYLRGVRAGAVLWFPTPAEAQKAAASYAKVLEEAAQAEKAAAWGQGSLAH